MIGIVVAELRTKGTQLLQCYTKKGVLVELMKVHSIANSQMMVITELVKVNTRAER